MTYYNIVQRILKEAKNRAVNIALLWINYKCSLTNMDNRMSKMDKVSDKDINFITKAMENWKVE